MRPGEVLVIEPAPGQGCPCEHCSRPWHEGLFADGTRQRGGICFKLGELLVTRAGCVSQHCPIPAIVGGEVHRTGIKPWSPVTVIHLDGTETVEGREMDRTPAKDAALGSRDRFPTLPGREDASSLVSSPNVRRERADIEMTEGRAGHFPEISSRNPNLSHPARLPTFFGGEP